MSTSRNVGDQELSFDYKNPATSESFNKYGFEVIKPGIYSGLNLSISGDNFILSAGTLFIKNINDGLSTELAVKVKNTQSDQLNGRNDANPDFNETRPFIVARMQWLNTENYFIDYLGVEFGSILDNDVILGKAVYSGSTLIGVDNTRRNEAIVKTFTDRKDNLKVLPTEAPSNQVTVTAGTAYINGKYVDVTSNLTVTIPDSVTNLYTIITLDDTGTASHESQTGSLPDFPENKLVLSTIIRTSASTIVTGDNINNLIFDRVLSPNINLTENLTIYGTTESTSKDTGTLILENGGMGVEGNIYNGGLIRNINSTQSTSVSTGAITTDGGIGFDGNMYNAGIIRNTNSTQSTSVSTGAFTTDGGIGFDGNMYNAGIIRNTNSTASTSTSTGAFTTDGGIGADGSIYSGNDIVAADDIRLSGKLSNRESSPDCVDGGMTLNQGSNDGRIITLKSDINHGITSIAETDTYGFIRPSSGTGGSSVSGGLEIYSITSGNNAFELHSIKNGALGYCIQLNGAKKSGTSTTGLGDNEDLLGITNNGGEKLLLTGDGSLSISGGFSVTYRNSSGTETVRHVKRKIIEIGDWNMDTTSNVSVNHGLIDYKKIRSVQVIVRTDADTAYDKLEKFTDLADPQLFSGGVSSISSTTINIRRRTGGFFDVANYTSTSYNRGWIYIDYEF